MSSKPIAASVFLTAGIAVLGIAVWVSVAGAGRQQASPEDSVALAQEGSETSAPTSTDSSIPLADLTESESVVEPQPEVEPAPVVEPQPEVEPAPVIAPAPVVEAEPEVELAPVVVPETLAPPAVVDGLHVLCPLRGGGAAHLLLTSETYYRAETPEEEALLTERFGPPVTNIDPSLLPPKSDLSVTEVLSA